jgi:hypothetical protein
LNDPARVTGHVVYRAVVDKADFPESLQWKAASKKTQAVALWMSGRPKSGNNSAFTGIK